MYIVFVNDFIEVLDLFYNRNNAGLQHEFCSTNHSFSVPKEPMKSLPHQAESTNNNFILHKTIT